MLGVIEVFGTQLFRYAFAQGIYCDKTRAALNLTQRCTDRSQSDRQSYPFMGEHSDLLKHFLEPNLTSLSTEQEEIREGSHSIRVWSLPLCVPVLHAQGSPLGWRNCPPRSNYTHRMNGAPAEQLVSSLRQTVAVILEELTDHLIGMQKTDKQNYREEAFKDLRLEVPPQESSNNGDLSKRFQEVTFPWDVGEGLSHCPAEVHTVLNPFAQHVFGKSSENSDFIVEELASNMTRDKARECSLHFPVAFKSKSSSRFLSGRTSYDSSQFLAAIFLKGKISLKVKAW
ncbi:hypothetical protein CEXT_378021 [Caerostris extrusa]|uniref:Uncharacterized protein n=1 Tax=Caerostris extrusa TaxID=172846 RepID=A0AAV4NKG8_CAEEX|nr:hypothetical protein CEXT_378021 [Caerostris extrusa]